MCISGLWETLASVGLLLVVIGVVFAVIKFYDWLTESTIGSIITIIIVLAMVAFIVIIMIASRPTFTANDWVCLGYGCAITLCVMFSCLAETSPFKTGAIIATAALLLLFGLVTYGHWANIYCGTDCGFLTEWGHFIFADTKSII